MIRCESVILHVEDDTTKVEMSALQLATPVVGYSHWAGTVKSCLSGQQTEAVIVFLKESILTAFD